MLETLMGVGSNTGGFTHVEVDRTSARGRRGDTPLDPQTFRLRDAIYEPDDFLTM